MGSKLTQKELKKILHYDPITGVFTWTKSRNGAGCKKGQQAGTIKKNRRIICINYKEYPSTHLAWLYMKGRLPIAKIDHKDRNTLNDKFKNLREVSTICNARNTGNYKNNSSGIKGVHKEGCSGKWIVQIAVNGKRKHLGRYRDIDEAICIRLAAEQCLDWDGCDSNSSAFHYVKQNIQGGR